MTGDPLADSNGRHDVSELVAMYRGHAKPGRAVPASADEIQRRMLDLAALLTPIAARPYCEINTMRLRQTARILVDRLTAARLV